MNNPIDISRMYGLNNTNTRTINSNDMHNKMQKLPPRANTHMTDEMNMHMHDEAINTPDEMWNEPCDMNKQSNMYSSTNNHSNMNDTKMHNHTNKKREHNKNMYSQVQSNTQLMPANSGMMTTSPMPNILLQSPTHTLNMEYMNDLLRTQVGKMADIEFLIGSNTTHIKRGQITGVGTNYIVIREYDTGRTTVGDFSDIKFVTIYDDWD